MRINLFPPKLLADQHLIAEYNELLMVLDYIRRYPTVTKKIEKFTLGSGHVLFFKDKIKYLLKRHKLIKDEMSVRGFKNDFEAKNIYPENLVNDWVPNEDDYKIIRKRITEKLLKKPDWYRYYGEKVSCDLLIKLLNI